MKFITLILAFVTGVALLSAPARAQETTGAAQDVSGSRSVQQQSTHDRLVQKVERAKYAKLKADLDLDDATAKQFFTIYKSAEKDIQAIVKERNEALAKLALLTNGTTKSDAEVAALLQKIETSKQQIADREQKLDNDLAPILSPSQKAKLMVFEHEFNERLREQLANGNAPSKANLREARRLQREERLKNKLLRKLAAEKAAEGH